MRTGRSGAPVSKAARWCSRSKPFAWHSLEGLGPVRLENGARFADVELALRIALADVDHLFDLADLSHRQVSAQRWEEATRELRGLVLTIEARTRQ
ncbi:MAG: hypothetical protein M3O34_04235 [Chloroflexota bacterium]|nr:hypothetical protein [Chloroflexota bacterium]